MFERFTEQARQVVVLAQDEARTLEHHHVGTEHILLGLLREKRGLAARVLGSLDISLEAVREQVRDIVGQSDKTPPGQIPFTPRARAVLQLSLREALSLGHSQLGTGHLMLGLVRQGDGPAMSVLENLGTDGGTVRTAFLQAEGWTEEQGPTQDEGLLTHDAARRAVVTAARAAAVAGRPVDPGDLIVALAETDDLAGKVLSRHVPLDQLAADLEAARKAAGS